MSGESKYLPSDGIEFMGLGKPDDRIPVMTTAPYLLITLQDIEDEDSGQQYASIRTQFGNIPAEFPEVQQIIAESVHDLTEGGADSPLLS